MIASPTNTTANVSNSVALTCTAAGIPPPQVQWFRNSLSLSQDRVNTTESTIENATSYFTTSTIVLCDLELSDTDSYSCVATNNISGGLARVSRSFSLTVQGSTTLEYKYKTALTDCLSSLF